MIAGIEDYYNILGVERNSNFHELKKAYYRKAKECHPDRFNNSPRKTEEFKILATAFDVLSDPAKRRRYDQRFFNDEAAAGAAGTSQETSIMDAAADDILEELIVGNTYPEKTSLATLLTDFAKTEVFMTFREGKNLLHEKRIRAARPFLLNAVSMSPHNIIYRIYLARCLAALHEYSAAKFHYRAALEIGNRRTPVQRLFKIRSELEMVKKAHRPFWSAFMGLFSPPESFFIINADEELIEQTNKMLTKLASRNNLDDNSKKLLKR
jgi:curved DNA-binding protein CbpA